jgi:hypothetical protein
MIELTDRRTENLDGMGNYCIWGSERATKHACLAELSNQLHDL